MTLVLLTLQIIISVLLIIIILLQRSDNDGFGLGASGGSNFLSSRGQANLLTRSTAILAAAFMANSLLMATIESRGGKTDIASEITAEQQKAKDAMQVPLDGVQNKLAPVEENKAIEAPKSDAPKIEPSKVKENKSIPQTEKTVQPETKKAE
jgi:preprotein translocase subunit SecG